VGSLGYFVFYRAGLRHVQGVRPNSAAKFRGVGAQFWTLQKFTCQFERLGLCCNQMRFAKCDCGRGPGFVPDPGGGAYSAP